MSMMKGFSNAFRIPELRKKIEKRGLKIMLLEELEAKLK